MRSEIIDVILIFLFIALIVFVFQGEPDLWDKWHESAMRTVSCGVEK